MRSEAEVFKKLELVAATEVGRGSAALARHAVGGLAHAAAALSNYPYAVNVAIVTGFYLPKASPPTAETDGPIGAAMIARAIELLGGTTRLITDEPCHQVVQAAVSFAGITGDLMTAPIGPAYMGWETATRELFADRPITHAIFVERVGPNYHGVKRNMRGEDISSYTAPLERLAQQENTFTIGIGDGGNEIGMGAVARDVIAQTVTRGQQIACVVPVDALVVGGTSNWGAFALTAALRISSCCSALDSLLLPAWSGAALEAIVAAGAADGVTLRRECTVDGLTPEKYASCLEEMHDVLQAYLLS